MRRIIVYYRHAPAEPEASFAALATQRADVAAYVRGTRTGVVAEFYEEASGCTGAVFSAACRACDELCAQLVVASIQPIGSGEPLRDMLLPVTLDRDISVASKFLKPLDPVILGEPL